MILTYKSVSSQSFFTCVCRSTTCSIYNTFYMVLLFMDGAHKCNIAWTAPFVATIAADCALVVELDGKDIHSWQWCFTTQCSWFLRNSEFAVAWPSSTYLVNNQIQPPVETYTEVSYTLCLLSLIRICTGILSRRNNQTDSIVMY